MRTAQAREWCLTALCLSALLTLAEDVLSIEGTAWLVVRAAVSAVFTTALVAWIVYAYRERQRATAGAWARSWAVPVLTAGGVVAVLFMLATLID